MRKVGIALIVWVLAGAATPIAVSPEVAAWAYPGSRTPPPPGGWDVTVLRSVPGSSAHFTDAQLHDLDRVSDWRPAGHPPMPAPVAHGRAPGIHACGFCHLANGGGRPENASLAGLPASYIKSQVAAFANASRTSAAPDYLPSKLMAETAHDALPAEIDAVAAYFSKLHFRSHVRVVETATVQHPVAVGFVLVPTGAREPIGERIVETPDDLARFERRDPDVGITAFVPPGALAEGAQITRRIGCAACHGAGLKLWGAGRSPSYIFRQLTAFKTGARHDPEAAPMTAVAAQLTTHQMIAVASFWASRTP